MNTKSSILVAAALAAFPLAVPANNPPLTPGPKTEKKEIGGSTAVLSPASWNRCSRIDAL